MAFLSIPHVAVRGIATCVPKTIDRNADYPMPSEELGKLVSTIGVEQKRIADAATCSSDLCYTAAERLIADLGWCKDDIRYLIFVSQTPDYITPATSCILQDRLGLSTACYTQDVSSGCSGWVYGLSTLASIISLGGGKGLLLVGDTISKFASREDKSTWPLFGDAGTATAVEYDASSPGFNMHLASDGEGYRAIIVEDGGYRNPTGPASLDKATFEGGLTRTRLQLALDGMSVFSFGISQAPKSVTTLLEEFAIDKDSVDYFIFHQANLFMNEKIRKKLKLDPDKVPYSLREFGNTSGATIPLTMTTELRDRLTTSKLACVGCAFGVGLSWGSVYFETDRIICPELIEL